MTCDPLPDTAFVFHAKSTVECPCQLCMDIREHMTAQVDALALRYPQLDTHDVESKMQDHCRVVSQGERHPTLMIAKAKGA